MSEKLKPIDKSKLSPLNRILVEGMEEIFGVTFVDATPQASPVETWHVLADEAPPEHAAIILKNDTGEYYAMREIGEAGDILHYMAIDGGPTYLIDLRNPVEDRSLLWRLFDEFDD